MSDSIANATKNVQNALANQARANEAVRLALIALTLAVSSEQAAQEAGQEAAPSTQDAAPVAQEAAPSTQEAAPATQEAAQEAAPAHEAAPAQEEAQEYYESESESEEEFGEIPYFDAKPAYSINGLISLEERPYYRKLDYYCGICGSSADECQCPDDYNPSGCTLCYTVMVSRNGDDGQEEFAEHVETKSCPGRYPQLLRSSNSYY